MAICCYARSSSLKSWEYCQQQYFIDYNLGIKQPGNKKAVMGTITHKVLEWLAMARLNHNDDKIKFFDDSLQEELEICPKQLMEVTTLEDKIVNEINKTRANKQIYKTGSILPYGSRRIGYSVVNDLVVKAFNHYSAKSPYDWTLTDLKNCGNWTWMALEWGDGYYDPRKRKIVSSECSFDMPVECDWGSYEYTHNNKKISGKFAIKGTIDLITEVDCDTLEIIDWKTGQRVDWATGEEKTYSKLCEDSQLALYHYAATKLFPKYKHIIFTIFFIRDGGPFTIVFDIDNHAKVEETLKNHFDDVRNTKLPKMLSPQQKDFRCTKLCSYYKNMWPGTDQNICRFIHNEIKRIGIDSVIDTYKQSSHTFEKYNSPGE